MMKRILCVALSCFLLGACRPHPPVRNQAVDRVVFGTFYGECAGDCVDFFAVDRSALAEDDAAGYSSVSWSYNFVPTTTLAASKHASAVSLLHGVPASLLATTNVTFGAPDSHDQGGTFLMVEQGGVKHRFIIDHDSTADQSAEVLAYKRRVHEVLRGLR